MYRALYRKWRPATFDDVVGQPQVTDILKYQVAENRVSHAYLFCGSRGTGKTSCAKILAKAVNCLHPKNGNPCIECEACRSIDAGVATDVIEMDAASNNGVDNVRDMKEEIVFTPADLKYRVYIIDEVHMMSGSAFNALLKTLEEPPAYVLFILATTELNKLPATIVSRCQRFDFRRLSSDGIVSHLGKIAKSEGIDLTDAGARIIARMSLGGMRDAISLLELCAGTNETVNEELVTRVLGVGGGELPGQIVDAAADRDYPTLYRLLSDVVNSAQDLTVFFTELISYTRDLVVVKTLGDGAAAYLDLSDASFRSLSERAKRIPLGRLLYQSRLLEETLEILRRSSGDRRATAELALTRLAEPRLSTSPEALLARVEELEKQVALLRTGASVPQPAVKKPAPDVSYSPAPVPAKETPKEEKKPTPAEKPAGTPAPKTKEEITEKKNEKTDDKTDADEAKQVPKWSLILDEFGRIKPSLGPFMRGSVATVSGEVVTVTLTVGMFLALVDGDETAKTVLLSLLSEHGTAASSIRFVSGAQKKNNDGQIEF
ncbi:MAG: DNA polymerase III subunit gamma/tau [Clostridia bacterium]|nr:DNA polymerase III subunit gamma/tau [Clostridia bacterium]